MLTKVVFETQFFVDMPAPTNRFSNFVHWFQHESSVFTTRPGRATVLRGQGCGVMGEHMWYWLNFQEILWWMQWRGAFFHDLQRVFSKSQVRLSASFLTLTSLNGWFDLMDMWDEDGDLEEVDGVPILWEASDDDDDENDELVPLFFKPASLPFAQIRERQNSLRFFYHHRHFQQTSAGMAVILASPSGALLSHFLTMRFWQRSLLHDLFQSTR